MQTRFELTPKQAEFIRNANHRWNVACGAVRSGKSHLAVTYLIPTRLLERAEKRGLKLILGATRANIERNVLQPLRDVYGNGAASEINSRNFASIFGQKVYCIGADNVRQVAKIRGSEISYCYIDEATDINEEVFTMLKSRLSLPYSCCDAGTNPASPNHYFKKFLDSVEDGVDVYCQTYTIYDNPFLPQEYVRALEAEYRGTVFFNRYILGEWTLAEGLIYGNYMDALVETLPDLPISEYALSIDYGTMNATAGILWAKMDDVWYGIKEYYYSGRDTGHQKTDEEYADDLDDFTNGCGEILTIVDPSAASFIACLRRRGHYRIRHADNDVLNGIRDTAVAIQTGKFKILRSNCPHWLEEAQSYVWDSSSTEDKPIKVMDHLMDSMRYFVKTMRLTRRLSGYKSPFS